MKLSCSTLHISHPVPIRHGPLGAPKQSIQPIIDHFLKIKEEGTPTNESWKTNHHIHLEHNILDPLLDKIHLWYCNNIVVVGMNRAQLCFRIETNFDEVTVMTETVIECFKTSLIFVVMFCCHVSQRYKGTP